MPTAAHFFGFERNLRSLAGARAVRVVHPASQGIDEHVHPWPCLTLHLLGAYEELSNGGCERIGGPAAVLQPAGSAHANRIADAGLETVSIMFDPAWLGAAAHGLRLDKPFCWKGGPVAAAARDLARAWSRPGADERDLAARTTAFLKLGCSAEPLGDAPRWLGHVELALSGRVRDTASVASELGLSADCLARSYRYWVGEGLRETIRRRRVERAVALLRSGGLSLRKSRLKQAIATRATLTGSAGRCWGGRLWRSLRKRKEI